MTTALPQTAPAAGPSLIRLPIRSMAVVALTAPSTVLFVAMTLAFLIAGQSEADRLRAVGWAGVAAYAGTIAGLAFLSLFGPRPALTWGTLVIAGSSLRMAVSVAVAAGVSIAIRPDPGFFWVTLLSALTLVLIVETVQARRALLTPRPGAPMESA